MRKGLSDSKAVEAYLRGLDHPLGPALQQVRMLILGAGADVAEGIKWNSPSFYSTTAKEYFATIAVYQKRQSPDCVQIILHQGAKVRSACASRLTIDDPAGLLQWLGSDRAVVRFADLKEVTAKRAALHAVLRQWLAQMD